jgi:chromosome segregation ATPase
MDRLLRGQIPHGGKCDIKTLAREADVDRTAFYGSRPYAHLREEFEQRLQALRTAGELPDPRDAQIARLKNEVDTLNQRIARRDQTIAELTDLNAEALSRLAAQHDEITWLRRQVDGTSTVRQLPTRPTTVGPCS